jgi:hypothetical protein
MPAATSATSQNLCKAARPRERAATRLAHRALPRPSPMLIGFGIALLVWLALAAAVIGKLGGLALVLDAQR